jgi:hypothetical protein
MRFSACICCHEYFRSSMAIRCLMPYSALYGTETPQPAR